MQRLLTRAQFQAVLAADVAAKTPHFVLHRKLLAVQDDLKLLDVGKKPLQKLSLKPLFPQQTVWLGALVPKRWARRAVTRNAIKRQIYALGAVCFSTDFAPAAFVVRLRRDFSRADFVSASSENLTLAVRCELQHLLQSARQALGNRL